MNDGDWLCWVIGGVLVMNLLWPTPERRELRRLYTKMDWAAREEEKLLAELGIPASRPRRRTGRAARAVLAVAALGLVLWYFNA